MRNDQEVNKALDALEFYRNAGLAAELNQENFKIVMMNLASMARVLEWVLGDDDPEGFLKILNTMAKYREDAQMEILNKIWEKHKGESIV